MERHEPQHPARRTESARRPNAILPLPQEAVAQIKSSTAIVSLTAVVLELLKNALDARASRIDATVDFSRGACSVEDNGVGIAPFEFHEEGGLGKLYSTLLAHRDRAYTDPCQAPPSTAPNKHASVAMVPSSLPSVPCLL